MKRMVKNGDLIDVEPDGTITVAGKPVGGGGSNDRELTLIYPFDNNYGGSDYKIRITDEIYQKINSRYYETIKVQYNDGQPAAVFHVVSIRNTSDKMWASVYITASDYDSSMRTDDWFGQNQYKYWSALLNIGSDSSGKYAKVNGYQPFAIPSIDKSKFDALYKLADKPTQDGTYVLKATVSGGAVTYTWVAQ